MSTLIVFEKFTQFYLNRFLGKNGIILD